MTALPVIDREPVSAAMYLRLSQDREGNQLGVDRQNDACRALAASLGWRVTEVVTDNDTSAFNGKARPGYERLLRLVEGGEVDAVVAYHADRLYRRLTDLERLVDVIERHRVAVRTVAAGEVDLTTASGRMTARILGAVAQHESERMGERIRMRQHQSAKDGQAHGGPRPFGYQRGDQPGTLVVDDTEAEIVREMARRVLTGESISAVAADLTARAVPTSTGGTRWTPSGVKRVLTQPALAGLRAVKGEAVGPAGWTAILSREDHERLRRALDRPKLGRKPRTYLLASMVFCGECGMPMGSFTTGDRAGESRPIERRRSYRCGRSHVPGPACGKVTVAALPLESFVVGQVLGALEGQDLARLRTQHRDSETARLTAAVASDETLLDELATDLGEQRIRRSEWLAARLPIEERLRANRAALSARGVDPLPEELADVTGEWEDLTFEQQRAIIALVVDRVVVRKARRSGRGFDTGRIEVVWR